MAHIVFYTKLGCAGGARQKALLAASGHTVEERSLLDTPWTPETLHPYLAKLETKDWYNKNAPAVKAGTVIPGALPADEALDLLSSDPILIVRPLLQIRDQLFAGFDLDALGKIIELREIPSEDLTECQLNSNINPCNQADGRDAR